MTYQSLGGAAYPPKESEVGNILPAKPLNEQSACAISTRDEVRQLMVEFLLDVTSPEMYGHAMPVEVVRRASRILQLNAGKRPGFGPPPPARCEACESE